MRANLQLHTLLGEICSHSVIMCNKVLCEGDVLYVCVALYGGYAKWHVGKLFGVQCGYIGGNITLRVYRQGYEGVGLNCVLLCVFVVVVNELQMFCIVKGLLWTDLGQ